VPPLQNEPKNCTYVDKHVFVFMGLLVSRLQLNVVSAKDVTCRQILLPDMLTIIHESGQRTRWSPYWGCEY